MKIKYLAAAFTLFMAMIMVYFWVETDRNEQTVLDMVYYNKELKNISRAADTGMERTDLETEYDCSLLFLTDGDYKFKLNEAISRGNVVLDYEKDGAIAGKIFCRISGSSRCGRYPWQYAGWFCWEDGFYWL